MPSLIFIIAILCIITIYTLTPKELFHRIQAEPIYFSCELMHEVEIENFESLLRKHTHEFWNAISLHWATHPYNTSPTQPKVNPHTPPDENDPYSHAIGTLHHHQSPLFASIPFDQYYNESTFNGPHCAVPHYLNRFVCGPMPLSAFSTLPFIKLRPLLEKKKCRAFDAEVMTQFVNGEIGFNDTEYYDAGVGYSLLYTDFFMKRTDV